MTRSSTTSTNQPDKSTEVDVALAVSNADIDDDDQTLQRILQSSENDDEELQLALRVSANEYEDTSDKELREAIALSLNTRKYFASLLMNYESLALYSDSKEKIGYLVKTSIWLCFDLIHCFTLEFERLLITSIGQLMMQYRHTPLFDILVTDSIGCDNLLNTV
ncbi:unnamed protein product [Schistosoma margrebowiei]|uniref:Uncharacterized protein n=1 Tax=Schistosoma margrebowiei TaxID=48269 RepID=A0A3P7YFE9_9TREM|nr:unnamed protein product [Schistosoma margrebowiei]